VHTPSPAGQTDLRHHAESLATPIRPGELVQALMDLGATICRRVTPHWAAWPCAPLCRAHALGRQSEFPVKPKRPKLPLRRGVLYIGRREDGSWLLEKRPKNGLLGGLQGWPGCIWDRSLPAGPPCGGDWHPAATCVHHGFSHFKVQIEVQTALLDSGSAPTRGTFVPADHFDPSALPVLMQKAFRVAEKEFASTDETRLLKPTHTAVCVLTARPVASLTGGIRRAVQASGRQVQGQDRYRCIPQDRASGRWPLRPCVSNVNAAPEGSLGCPPQGGGLEGEPSTGFHPRTQCQTRCIDRRAKN